MIFVLSGEGVTDLGACTNGQGECGTDDFSPGPMCILLDQLLQGPLDYSPLESTPHAFRYISETALTQRAAARKANHRNFFAPGKHRGQETGYFYANAWDLGTAAREMEVEDDVAVAVLFRDNDPMRSSPPTMWESKWRSMMDGFTRAEFPRGVPMLPNPKSEAWLMCAAKPQPFQHCAALEQLSGNDDAPNSAKRQLAATLGGEKSAPELNEWLSAHPFDAEGASDMPSFAAFNQRLQEVVQAVVSGH